MSEPRIIDMASRRDFNERMLARLVGHQGFHSDHVGYGLGNVLRILPGTVSADVISTMLITFLQPSGAWLARIDEIRPVKDEEALDLVLAPFVTFSQTGVCQPIKSAGVNVIYGVTHKWLVYSRRSREDDIGYIRPPLLPSSW